MNISGIQNQSQKRCEARDVSNAQTDVSLRHSHVHYPDHTACVTMVMSGRSVNVTTPIRGQA